LPVRGPHQRHLALIGNIIVFLHSAQDNNDVFAMEKKGSKKGMHNLVQANWMMKIQCNNQMWSHANGRLDDIV